MKYYLIRLLHLLTLGVVREPCPSCKKGYLTDGHLDSNWVSHYECDYCRSKFK